MSEQNLDLKVTTTLEGDALPQVTQGVEDLGKAVDKTTGTFTEAQKENAQFQARMLESDAAAKKLKGGLDEAANSMGGMKMAAKGMGDVLSGVAGGDMVQLGKGMLELKKAADLAGTALAGGLRVALGTVAIAAGPVLIAIAAMKKVASENQKAMEQMWDEAKKKGDAYRLKVAEVEKAHQEAIAADIKRVKELEAAYSNLIANMDKASAHAQRVIDAKEKLDLAGTDDPAAQAKIKADSRATSRSVEDDNLRLKEIMARKNNDQGSLDEVARTRELNAINRQTEDKLGGKAAAGDRSAMKSRQAELEAQARSAATSGDNQAQDKAVDELRKLTVSIKKYDDAMAGATKATSTALDATSGKLLKNTSKITRNTQSGPVIVN